MFFIILINVLWVELCIVRSCFDLGKTTLINNLPEIFSPIKIKLTDVSSKQLNYWMSTFESLIVIFYLGFFGIGS